LGETRALLIIKGGKIIYERYGNGYGKDSKLLSWSMGKSILSALIGVEIAQNKLTLDTPINDPHYKDGDARRKITYKQALNMTDGLDWREENYSNPISNDAAIMLFGAGKEDVVKYVTSRKLKHEAGKYWNYSSGTSNMIAAGASRVLGPRDINDPTGRLKFRDYLYTQLLHKIGMKDTAAEFDAAGNLYASSFFYATARDYAKFGLLFLRDGVWSGERLLPQGYVDFVRTPVEAQNAANYGAHWWLNRKDRDQLLKNSPEDAFMARGHQGQLIVVIPSKDMVVVRLGLSPDENSWKAIGDYMDKVIAAAN
jgi:CubicO group peptidase (beta-lactamase class C family)